MPVEALDRARHDASEFVGGNGALDRWLRADAGQAQRRVPPQFPIPVVLIARLAVAFRHQGRGTGRDLLRRALRRIVVAGEQIGIRAVLMDAVDASSAAFYERHGFEAATLNPLTLMIPLAAVRAVLR